MSRHLHRFHGGLDLPAHKREATAGAIVPCPLPDTLVLSLLQHAGALAEPLVRAGDQVAAGQCIARVSHQRGAHLHAPAAGRVRGVEARPLPGMPGIMAPHVVLDVDPGQTVPVPVQSMPGLDPWSAPRETLLERIREAGISGMGGAGFPTAEKLSVPRSVLVINGAECEPYVACDDRLIREQAGQVVAGSRLLQRIVGAERVVIAVEDTMGEALAALRGALDALANPEVELVAVPSRYPQGGERQLIQVLTGREVPRDGLPRDLGVLVHNVATAVACWRAVSDGRPLCSRVVTVTGPGVARPGNFEVAIGTPVSHLVAMAGGYTPRAARLVLGGPMMGQALPDDTFPITKSSLAVLVLGAEDVAPSGPELPCIRCGECASACPARLLPQQLLWDVLADALDRSRADGLFDCIECGCCDLACPSHIPLTQHFRHAKTALRERDREAAAAHAARERHDARQARVQRLEDERAERAAARKAALSSGDAVKAAIERARARKLDP